MKPKMKPKLGDKVWFIHIVEAWEYDVCPDCYGDAVIDGLVCERCHARGLATSGYIGVLWRVDSSPSVVGRIVTEKKKVTYHRQPPYEHPGHEADDCFKDKKSAQEECRRRNKSLIKNYMDWLGELRDKEAQKEKKRK